MSDKVVQLHDKDGNNIYPVTSFEALSGNEILTNIFVQKSGDTITGTLISESSFPQIQFKNTNLSDGRMGQVFLGSDKTFGLANRLDANNRQLLYVNPETSDLDKAVRIFRVIGGSGTSYNLYGEHNIPPINKVNRSVVIGSNSSTAITGWFPVGKIAINGTYISKVVTLAVHGGAGCGSGILQIIIRVEGTSGVISNKSYLRWISATHEINESNFAIDASDKTNAILYMKLDNRNYTAFTFSVLAEKFFGNRSASKIITLEDNYVDSPVEGTNYKTSITQSLTSSRAILPSTLRMYDGVYIRDVIQLFDDEDGSNYGSELVITAGGNIFLGSGESATGVRNDLQANGPRDNEPAYGKNNERLYLTSDGEIVISTNANTPANRKSTKITGSGAIIVPTNTDYSTYKARNIAAGTTDLTAGSSSLATGNIYLVYE